MTPDLTDEETAALLRELDCIIDADRYPFSSRIRTLMAIRDKLRPPTVREPVRPRRCTRRRGRRDAGEPARMSAAPAPHPAQVLTHRNSSIRGTPDG
jgi:hypothetical protein